ncbi:inorganic phosphate transporter [Mesorhizobium sp. M1C.F.Ca.ET.193.01.1.1]|uniref:inorganic phosphate transporter n=1 Tax=unclassified Mesorhizobium TaxID=325217 RepID=UPI000FD5B356|nr:MULTISPECIES: inorganic phosphate transporter [unclassified Mesorhizobium]TGT04749.1 inorganic phosphate transporter [bacterium M00.F.Ca.ET.177.01.1.1]TGQ57578.1 inorganic phosphate transporter [Mesorhizobium sp. M1C.F.Ca.ET.210.01.1.1]TGQ76035.1 inorganic phosphate transporter [Mesorhizobium sp. M1C.F.Ca.ET.212.01.1.1]TGR14419.1 inorganic phosphate transporter [Mesorhizobium sp. M1C.F.Ca.ET.204.01.1.1]TGR35582.1 inorganic phosphate transporter [Mesorhizobium sp. M1C.F.Ca.ET.196.01.1.1]
MVDVVSSEAGIPRPDHPLEQSSGAKWFLPAFGVLVLAGLIYVGYALSQDLAIARTVPWILLGIALLIALGFEFVNGFHDTANAVATVIYTRSLPAEFAVMWSGVFNFLGVLTSSGAVAFGILSLLPVELILQVGSSSGFAMVFALLVAAILWNLGTWFLGLPASSSHTMVGSIIGVGLANQFMAPAGSATSGVEWGQASNVGLSLLISPLVGFFAAAILLYAMKFLVRNPALYEAPKGNTPPPWWIRALLIFTCTGVSFAHGSNDGQKGMGLIMLILIGVVPTAYALNRTPDINYLDAYKSASVAVEQALGNYAKPGVTVADAKAAVQEAVRRKTWNDQTTVALQTYIHNTTAGLQPYATVDKVPTDLVSNARNDIYLIGEALKLIDKKKLLPMQEADLKAVTDYHKAVDNATKFIPLWVKIAVALALGLGTMVGWKRIVVTVGEKIGKSHLTYGQGAAAELVAMVTIGMADRLGLPVSTTHVLSSGVAGTMAANGSGLQWATVRNLLLAWVLTLPCSIALSFVLFVIFRQVF